MAKVLLIDDQVGSESMQARMEWLQAKGLDVVGVDSSTAALETLRRESFDLVLLDILMPFKDHYGPEETAEGTNTGVRLLADIKLVNPRLPIVLLTIKPPQQVLDARQRYSIEGYVSKPAMASEIYDEIRRVLRL